MPNPKLETYKNKATGTVYDFTDADAQSKVTATVDLMKDTTGWIGGNLLPNLLTNGTDSAGVTYTKNADGSVSMSASTISANTDRAIYDTRDTGVVNFLKGESLVLYKGLEDTNVKMLINAYQDNSYVKTIVDLENGVTSQPFILDYVGYNRVRITVYVKSTADLTTPKTIFPMIITEEQYALNPSYRPYHETVAEMLTPKLLTSANDLDNVKTYGDYYWEQSYPTNSPENNTFGALRVLPCGEVIHQMVIRAAANSASIYLRRFQETWSSWYKFSGTVVS